VAGTLQPFAGKDIVVRDATTVCKERLPWQGMPHQFSGKESRGDGCHNSLQGKISVAMDATTVRREVMFGTTGCAGSLQGVCSSFISAQLTSMQC